MPNQKSSPINLTTITPQSSMTAINNNFRKIQAELTGFRDNVEPRIQAGESAQALLERYLGPQPPVSKREAFEYTEEFTVEYAQKRISSSTEPPSDPEVGDLWLDPSTQPPTFKRWNAETGEWEKLSATTFEELEGMIDKSQLPDRVIDSMKLAIDAVQAENLAEGSVYAEAIQAEAVGAQAIAANAILAKHIAAGEVTANEIAADAVTADAIAAGAVLAEHISANSINSSKIATEGLNANVIKTGVLDADLVAVQSESSGTYIDDQGILVNSGNFRLQDDITQIESLVRENANMVNDHSFEMVPRGNTMYSSARFNVDTSKLGNYFWWNLGGGANFARIQSTYGTDDIKRAKFGRQAAVLLDFDTTYWWQEVELSSERGTAGPYTLSCYFAAFEETSSTTTCRIALYAYDDNFNYLGTVGSVMVDVSPNEPYKWKRDYVTVRNLPSSTTYLRIILSTWGGGTALADGVQLVPFELPIVYEAEEGIWKTLRNMAGYSFPQLTADEASILGNLFVGGGSGNVYANQLRSQRFDGDMYIRPTDGHDVLVAAPSATWRRVLASDFVQQSSENIKTNIEPMPESALELINQSVVYKYNKDGMDEKEYGLIVERETPQEIIRGEGVSSYSMSSFAWKAIQELSEKVEELERKIGGIQ